MTIDEVEEKIKKSENGIRRPIKTKILGESGESGQEREFFFFE